MIFNSLGSNYNFGFVVRSLFSFPSNGANAKLKALLDKKYYGETILLYKGREAIKLALKISNLPKGSKVGVNGFTCYVVYQAIVEAGYKPVYLDIDGKGLNFDIENLQKHNDVKALVMQNTLGNPVNIVPIKSFCDKNNILIIEDLAHSAGGKYPNGSEIGTVGDFTALSFSQDKIIDAISGGALVVRNKIFRSSLNKLELTKLPLINQIHDRIYPLLTFKIRKLYPVGIGKPLHFLFKKSKILSDPMGPLSTIKYHPLPNWYANLALFGFSNLGKQIRHRRIITDIYLQRLDTYITSGEVMKNYNLSSNIRFPIFVENRKSLTQYLKDNGIYVSDVWYDAAIAPSKLINRTNYNGECPISDEISKQIVNLPTHINVTMGDAEKISVLINKWQNLNQR